MFEEWLMSIKKKYEVNIEVENGDNYFVSKTYKFSYPLNKGLAFSISLDDEDLPSAFSTPLFIFEHFNKAENVKAEDIITAGTKCLEGDLILKKTFMGKYKIEFNLPTFKGYSIAVKVNNQNVPHYASYQKKT